MTLFRTCQRCGGEGIEPFDYYAACSQCNGKGREPGRPETWPAVGSKVTSTEHLGELTVLPGEDHGLVHLEGPFTAGAIAVKPGEFGPGGTYRSAEPADNVRTAS
jgi:hypothetical protein